MDLEKADELKAAGHEKIAEGHALIARALRMQRQLEPQAAVVAVRVIADELGIEPRVLTDAGRRGELRIDHAGRKPVVARDEVQRWISGRRVSRKTPAAAREAARAAVAHRATRATR